MACLNRSGDWTTDPTTSTPAQFSCAPHRQRSPSLGLTAACAHRTIWRRLIFQEAKNTARLAQGPPTSYHRPADQWQTRGTTCRMSAAGTRSLAASASLDDVGARSSAQLPTAGFGPLASQRRLWPPPDRAAQEPMKSTIAVRCPAPAPAPTRPVVC